MQVGYHLNYREGEPEDLYNEEGEGKAAMLCRPTNQRAHKKTGRDEPAEKCRIEIN